MEQDDLYRLREQLERLYHKPSYYQQFNRPNLESDRPGVLQVLRSLWQRVSPFFTEQSPNKEGDLLWWQIHSWRMGMYAPLFSENDFEGARAWLERMYQVRNNSDR